MKKPTTIKDEESFRKYVHATGEELGFHVSHIESHATSAGIPDLTMYREHVDLWLEIKFVRSDGRVILRPTQRTWLRERAAKGGECWVMYYQDGYVRVMRGGTAANLTPKDSQWSWPVRFPIDRLPELLEQLWALQTGVEYPVKADLDSPECVALRHQQYARMQG